MNGYHFPELRPKDERIDGGIMIESTHRGYAIEQRYVHYVPSLKRGFLTEEDAHRAIDALRDRPKLKVVEAK